MEKALYGNGSDTGKRDISTLQERGHFYLALTLRFAPTETTLGYMHALHDHILGNL